MNVEPFALFAVCVNVPAHKFNNVARNGKAKTGTAV